MKRIFNFKSFILNEKRAQLKIPFAGTDDLGKMHHDHILDAFDDAQVMKPEAYTTDTTSINTVIDKVKPAVTMLLIGEAERMKNHIVDFVYSNIENNIEYWEPAFFEENDIETQGDDTFGDIYEDVAEAMVSNVKTPHDALTNEGKEAFDEFLSEKIDDEIYTMVDTVEDSMRDNDGLISVWRAITYHAGEEDDVYNQIIKGHRGGVGIYWSWEEGAAEAHWGESGKLFVLHGQVRPEDVNWEASVFKNVYDLKEEQELEMIQTAAIKLVGMGTSDENGKDVFIKFDPEYVVKVGSTYKP